jgi:putative ABC transport system permease protein
MLIGEMIAVALQSILANLFRGFLTMLGIIIGVASVITMVALGSGAQQAVDAQIDSLGASVLSIYSSSKRRHGVKVTGGSPLVIDDAIALHRDATTIDAVVPEMSDYTQIKYLNQNQRSRVIGTTPNFAEVQGHTLTEGRMFTEADESGKRKVVVIGAKVPNKMVSGLDSLLGRSLYLNGVEFEVIGMFAEKGSSSGWRNIDEQLWIPLQTARYRLRGEENLDGIGARVKKGVSVEKATIDIERVMRREHQIMPGDRNDFSIGDPREFQNIREEATNIFAYLLASIASVSLIVGGIGIMNIMLVTVTERTREIGIRKALGATRVNILMQFMVEAMVLCLLGGTLGILLGIGISELLANMLGWSTPISIQTVIIAFVFSAFVGIFFGIWPARKAAIMDPIEALRYE